MPTLYGGAVEMDRWIEVARRRRLETANALAEFVMDSCRRGDVALFGSRARGDFHDMSDWDIAVVVEDGEYAVASEEFGQAVYIPVARLDQLLTFSMIILDVAHDGHLLCGKGDLWHEFVKRVRRYVMEKRLEKTGAGWYPSV
ncbi:MAG: nucleotidyltransferase domain-containing protein [Thermoproteus sp.]